MKLPNYRAGSAASLVTKNIRAPLVEMQSRVAAMKAFSIPIANAATEYQEREDHRELEEAILKVSESDSQLVAQRKGVEEFFPMKETDENFLSLVSGMDITDPEKAVPGHKVYPEWRAKNYRSIVEESASGISSKRAREAFMKEHQMIGNANYAKDAVVATGDQIKYHAKQTMVSVDSALLDRNYELASKLIDGSRMSTSAKAAAQNAVATDEQMNYFNESLETQELGKMQRDLHKLITNDTESTGMIPAQQQRIFANMLRTAIGTTDSKNTLAASTQMKLSVADARIQITDIWNRKPLNIEDFWANYETIKVKHPVLAREMEWTFKHQPNVNKILLASPTMQTMILKSIEDGSKGSIEESYVIGQLEKAMEHGRTARKSNTLSWGMDVGIVDVAPLDFNSIEAIQQGLAARIEAVISLQNTYGTYTGFLTNAEADEFGQRIENAGVGLQIEMFTAINTALGQYAEPFYEQLKEYNVSEIAPLAGQIASWGESHTGTARKILQGAQLRKTDELTKLMEKERGGEWDSYAVQKFAGIFGGNKRQQSLSIEAFRNLMVVNPDMDANFDAITGGVVGFKGYQIQAPLPGMSDRDYRKYVILIPPVWWSHPENRMYGFTPAQAHKMFRRGELIQIGTARGESYLENSKGERMRTEDGVTQFVLKFDIDELNRQQYKVSDEIKKINKAAEIQAMNDKAARIEALNLRTLESMTKYITEPMDTIEDRALEEE